jgi:hypothetical protein
VANNHTGLHTDVERWIFSSRVNIISGENVYLNGYIISDSNEKTDIKCIKMYVEVLRHFNTEKFLMIGAFTLC